MTNPDIPVHPNLQANDPTHNQAICTGNPWADLDREPHITGIMYPSAGTHKCRYVREWFPPMKGLGGSSRHSADDDFVMEVV